MVSSRASNVEFIEDIPIAELIEEKVTKPALDTFIDQGLPIPEQYDVDTIRAMVQDPFHIWVYWEMQERVFEGLKKIFPTQVAETFNPSLKITELTHGHTTYINIGTHGSYWLSVFPDRRYRLEVGLYSKERGFIRLLEADEVRTPRGTISMEVPESTEYKIPNHDFTELLQISGFASFTDLLAPERVVQYLPPEVSATISSAAEGQELTQAQIDALPPRIRAILQEIRARGGDELTSLALLHLLPEYLREAIEQESELFLDPLHPQHIAPRFMAGSSENVPKPTKRRWMPSMTERESNPAKLAPGSPVQK